MSIARYICVRFGPDSIWAVLFKRAMFYCLMATIGYVIIITVATDEFGRPYGGIEVSISRSSF